MANKKYRLKKEAIPFFNEKFAAQIEPFEFWKEKQVDDNALEEVEPVYITFGIKTSETCKDLSSFDYNESHAEFRFTLNFPSSTAREYNDERKGRSIRALMDAIQEVVNEHRNETTGGSDE